MFVTFHIYNITYFINQYFGFFETMLNMILKMCYVNSYFSCMVSQYMNMKLLQCNIMCRSSRTPLALICCSSVMLVRKGQSQVIKKTKSHKRLAAVSMSTNHIYQILFSACVTPSSNCSVVFWFFYIFFLMYQIVTTI